MDTASHQEGRVIRAPQLRRGKEEVSITERVIQTQSKFVTKSKIVLMKY